MRFRLEGVVSSVALLRGRVEDYRWRQMCTPQFPQRVGNGLETWGPRRLHEFVPTVHYRVAELYATLKGHREWLRGRVSENYPGSPLMEKLDEIDRIVDAMDLLSAKSVLYAAVFVERVHRPTLTFRQTFEYLMSDGRRQARDQSHGFAYTFCRAFDAI